MQVKRKQEFTMKTKLQILITVLSIVFSMARASGQPAAYINSQSGLPQPINPQTGLPEEVTKLDPATGLPADGSPPFKDTNGVATWIDPSWNDPGTVVMSVSWDDLPLSEVANQLREQFTNYFDIILPDSPRSDPTQYSVHLRLKNVRASEIFNAMNLEFELDNTPLRWELTTNGSRPTALLRYLPQLAPPPPQQVRKIFFVGDIMDENSGTNEMKKLQSISAVIELAWVKTGMLASGGGVDTYPSGQLLIVSGTPDQVDLAEQTLRALKEKAEFEKTGTLAEPRNP
jgi:hypothetical protein